MRRTSLALAIALASFALAAGCGGDDDETTATTAETTTEEEAGAAGEGGGGATEVSMTEYSFGPSDPTVSAGDTLEVVNDGEIPHNLSVTDAELATSDLDGGGSEELTVDLEPGTYEFICTIGNHADLGMTGTLTVE